MDKPVIIFGADSLGVAALEIFESNQIIIFGFLDDNPQWVGREIGDVSVLSGTDDQTYLKYIGQKCEAFIASDDMSLRKSLVKTLNDQRKVMPVNAIHKTAWLSKYASIGHGNFINMGAKIGTKSSIGNHCIIHSNVTIDHNSTIHDYCQIGSGTIISTDVTLGKGSFIGAGSTIVSGVSIGKNARVGAGSVVIRNIKDNETVFGNPAEKMPV
ncbi:MAG: acetyltransferase [Cyclobacteriaceae bacterium]|nr:acetyltransferase [Cyclobacteriaceae bacterium]